MSPWSNLRVLLATVAFAAAGPVYAGSVLPDPSANCGAGANPCQPTGGARPGFVLPQDDTRTTPQLQQQQLQQAPFAAMPASGDAAFGKFQNGVDEAVNGQGPDARRQGGAIGDIRARVNPARQPPPNSEEMTAGGSRANGGCTAQPTQDLPFKITVDGTPIAGGERNVADSQRCVDAALAKADIQIRYDGLQSERRLNVLAAPDAAEKNTTVLFSTFNNYSFWLSHAEVRILRKEQSSLSTPMTVLPVERGLARWQIPSDAPSEVRYVLRVYDASGRFDETVPKILNISDLRSGTIRPGELLAVYEGNALKERNIPVAGGTIIVSGRGLAPGTTVKVMGLQAPLDAKGDFVMRQILSPGTHDIEVSISDKTGVVSEFSRSASIPSNDFFYVAMADITAGRNNSHGAVEFMPSTGDQQYESKYIVNGRTAFYFKGLIKGEYLLTAAADSQEQPIRSMFSNLDSKDPRYLLRSLDPNRYYPVYGDDSTLIWDAPTRGKFYVRLERGASSIVWGNFKTTINGTEFVRYDRGLYGAQVKVATDEATKYGERKGQAEAFVAKSGTTGARDVFRGTGGSLYYLRRQAITQGSDRVSIETRDATTGLVLQSRVLTAVQDYEIDYLQGRIVLRSPLSSFAPSTMLIQGGTSGSLAEQYLVVTYEYAPSFDPTKDAAVGGRTSYWVNDHVEVGATGYNQSMPGEKQQILGSDVTVRYKPGTYVKLEGARSTGPGSGEGVSIDGGFTFDNRATNGQAAYAKKIEGAVDLADITPDAKGRVSGFWKERDAGFSGPGQLAIDHGGREAGLLATAKVDKDWSVRGKVDAKEDLYRKYESAEANVSRALGDEWMFTTGVKIDNNDPRVASASSVLNQKGQRADAGVRVDYDSKRDWTTYAYAQGTLERTGNRDPNDRIGVGGSIRLTEKLTARGEVSEGSGGLGARIGTDYRIDERQTAYVNYILDPDRTDILANGGEGVLVTGGRTRFSDNASVFGEERYRTGGGYSGLTHAYGLDFVPYQHWRAGVGAEYGDLHDPLAGDIKRVATTGSVGYSNGGLTYSGKAEFRNDKTDSLVTGPQSRDTYLARNTIGVKITEDWRFIGRLNGSYSSSSLGTFYNGNYLEAVTGFAYRPVADDRLNMLFKYTFFYDAPSGGQITLNGSTSPFSQQSNVLSVDVAYDLLKWLTLGGKYAFRTGELRDNSIPGPWFGSTAHLIVGRLDFNFVKEWDALAEVRMLDVPASSDRRAGMLIGVYRHLNDNVKIGIGYNFTNFSDDLTYLKYDRQGVFVNALAKY